MVNGLNNKNAEYEPTGSMCLEHMFINFLAIHTKTKVAEQFYR